MADTKVSALTALGAAPASNDLIPVVDVDDTTMAASGTTKSMTQANLESGLNLANQTGTVAIGHGGTGQTSASAAFSALSPMTTLGDTMYEDGTPIPVRLAGNSTSTKKFLTQTGTGSVSAAPGWNTIAAADYPAMVGDSGSGGTQGAAPAPGAGDAAAGKFLKADGTWAAPAGGGGGGMWTKVTSGTSGSTFSYGSLSGGNVKLLATLTIAAGDFCYIRLNNDSTANHYTTLGRYVGYNGANDVGDVISVSGYNSFRLNSRDQNALRLMVEFQAIRQTTGNGYDLLASVDVISGTFPQSYHYDLGGQFTPTADLTQIDVLSSSAFTSFTYAIYKLT